MTKKQEIGYHTSWALVLPSYGSMSGINTLRKIFIFNIWAELNYKSNTFLIQCLHKSEKIWQKIDSPLILTQENLMNPKIRSFKDSKEYTEKLIMAADLVFDGFKNCFTGNKTSCSETQRISLYQKHVKE